MKSLLCLHTEDSASNTIMINAKQSFSFYAGLFLFCQNHKQSKKEKEGKNSTFSLAFLVGL